MTGFAAEGFGAGCFAATTGAFAGAFAGIFVETAGGAVLTGADFAALAFTGATDFAGALVSGFFVSFDFEAGFAGAFAACFTGAFAAGLADLPDVFACDTGFDAGFAAFEEGLAGALTGFAGLLTAGFAAFAGALAGLAAFADALAGAFADGLALDFGADLADFADFDEAPPFAEAGFAAFSLSLSDFDLALEAFFLSGLAI